MKATDTGIAYTAEELRARKMGLFGGFDNFDELQNYIDNLEASERHLATVIMGMTYNTTFEVLARRCDAETAKWNAQPENQ